MDSLNVFNHKIEKSNAILKHRMRQKITTLFRFVELFFLLVMISRFSFQFAFSVNISGDYLRRISSALFSPRFVFVIGNAIVITLFLKSGWITTQYNSTGDKSSSDFCIEYVEKSVSDEFQRIEDTVVFGNDDHTERKICRSRSENLNRGGEKQSKQLRRSATERCRKSTPAVSSYSEEEMSGEEFRRTVEEFIARQQKFLREEEFPAIVSH